MTQSLDPIVIVSAVRTPMGGLQGAFADLTASTLGAAAIRAAVNRAGLAPETIEEVVMGCVLPAGQGQAPARQALIAAGLPLAAGATTINKMCGSGMKAVMFAHDMIRAGSVEIAVAGGMESMTGAPYLLPKARSGYRMGHGQVIDHMFLDGLEDAYDRGRLMGTFAEDCAAEMGFSRESQDAFALSSLERARSAIAEGRFASEIVGVETRNGLVDIDEQPGKARPEKIPTLKPAFRTGGTVTAANSSSISDGAAALVLMRASEAERRGLNPLARILGHSSHAAEPGRFPTAPIGAMEKLYAKTGLGRDDFDLYEINEAFAVVTMATMKVLGLDHERVNVNGGACALGHPIGASGARILVTLLAALKARSFTRGMASICIGGGEATAIAVERIG
ncbi:acetyl-CoA C-acyltransferase [Rhizobium alvei]|uniref:Acetyl-CoA C-acyltransferase n=1 Tax=Rhizobium alvei TaxID=1132659 RepID=A0ABT8YQN6_9HYPH|nr:acetyl-CoA C-acyltransferase [Rhizobium alvei]MDO6965951.1 acetyl-CoA C-acyltransferase [Rhizobium alvei]